ncbi:MAG TPA: hypothetical protein VEU30_02135, partial [Thermoanaerobaculia bacterium]|nr:hypothetical protein [Thermoanaerobaculia bacterium]
AQPVKPVLSFNPINCIKAGELALLQVDVAGEGEIRAYFRRVNTTDWCSVEGTNEGPLSRVVLPKFESGEEIEYFFVMLEGRRVMARSPRMYRSRVSNTCETPFARHMLRISMNCGQDQAAVPSSVGAGMSIEPDFVAGDPPYSSPDRPESEDEGNPPV